MYKKLKIVDLFVGEKVAAAAAPSAAAAAPLAQSMSSLSVGEWDRDLLPKYSVAGMQANT